jgi:signal peptidase
MGIEMNVKGENRGMRMRRNMKIVNWVMTIALAFVILVSLFLYLSPDYDLYVLRSESMKPTLNMGDVIIAGPASGSPLTPGTIVTFVRNRELVTHRVVSIDGNNVSTKGDALEEADPWLVPISDIKSIYLFKIPYLGYVTSFVRTKLGWFLLIILPAMLIVGFLVKGIIQEALRDETPGKTRRKPPAKTAAVGKADAQPAVSKPVTPNQAPAPARPRVTPLPSAEPIRMSAPSLAPHVNPPLDVLTASAVAPVAQWQPSPEALEMRPAASVAPAVNYQERTQDYPAQQSTPHQKVDAAREIAAEMTRRKIAAWINSLGTRSTRVPRMTEITVRMAETVAETTDAIQASADALEEWAGDLNEKQEKKITRQIHDSGNGKSQLSEEYQSPYYRAGIYH